MNTIVTTENIQEVLAGIFFTLGQVFACVPEWDWSVLGRAVCGGHEQPFGRNELKNRAIVETFVDRRLGSDRAFRGRPIVSRDGGLSVFCPGGLSVTCSDGLEASCAGRLITTCTGELPMPFARGLNVVSSGGSEVVCAGARVVLRCFAAISSAENLTLLRPTLWVSGFGSN